VYPADRSNGAARYAVAGDWYLERFILERTH
jgi:hypothetical protein